MILDPSYPAGYNTHGHSCGQEGWIACLLKVRLSICVNNTHLRVI